MATRTDAALLQLLWLASPALPVGGFSYSEGLESAVEASLVTSEEQAGDWLVDQLRLVLARSDLPVMLRALQAWRDADLEQVRMLDDWVRRTRETSELRLQAEQMGRSLGDWQRSIGQDADTAALTYPVAFARAAAVTQASARDAGLAFAFGWSENMVQAAVRAVPLGQSAGQRILQRLAQAVPQAVDTALGLGDDERQAFAPMLAILSSQHETQYSRLFRS